MMKRPLLILCVAMIGIASCENHSPGRSKTAVTAFPNEKKKPGKIEFTEEMHNFGTLKDGETVAFSFRFKNTGEAPFRLKKVEPTCGCLSVRFNNDAVESQSRSEIEVIFHTDGEWGNQIKTVEVETSGGELKTLTIVAYVENKNLNIDLNNLK